MLRILLRFRFGQTRLSLKFFFFDRIIYRNCHCQATRAIFLGGKKKFISRRFEKETWEI